MKTCKRCHAEKPLTEFYAQPGSTDGRMGSCKDCIKKQVSERYKRLSKSPEFIEAERARGREKYHRLRYWEAEKKRLSENPSLRESKNAAVRRNTQMFPEKKRARTAAAKLPKKEGHHHHHWSYRDEHMRDVMLVPMADHYTLHRFSIYDQERRQFRTRDGVLLDTRQAYLEFAKALGVTIL